MLGPSREGQLMCTLVLSMRQCMQLCTISCACMPLWQDLDYLAHSCMTRSSGHIIASYCDTRLPDAATCSQCPAKQASSLA